MLRSSQYWATNLSLFRTVGPVLALWQHLICASSRDKDDGAGIDPTFGRSVSSGCLQSIGLEWSAASRLASIVTLVNSWTFSRPNCSTISYKPLTRPLTRPSTDQITCVCSTDRSSADHRLIWTRSSANHLTDREIPSSWAFARVSNKYRLFEIQPSTDWWAGLHLFDQHTFS